MEIELTKRGTQNSKFETKYYKLSDFKVLASNPTLLIIQEGAMEVEDVSGKTNANLLEIFKVQFIASCKAELQIDLLVACYIGEHGSFHAHVLDGLPDNYYQEGGTFKLVDYKSYSDICEITGETKLSLGDYILALTHSHVGQNALLHYNQEFLNYDKQKALWKEIDSKKSVSN